MPLPVGLREQIIGVAGFAPAKSFLVRDCLTAFSDWRYTPDGCLSVKQQIDFTLSAIACLPHLAPDEMVIQPLLVEMIGFEPMSSTIHFGFKPSRTPIASPYLIDKFILYLVYHQITPDRSLCLAG